MIYPEFRSRTPPPTYVASMLDYEEFRRPRRLSSGDVVLFPASLTSAVVEPVPATPPPAYHGRAAGRSGAVRGRPPVYCPRALRRQTASFLAADNSSGPATTISTTSAMVPAPSAFGTAGKFTPDRVGHGMADAASSKVEPANSWQQPESTGSSAGPVSQAGTDRQTNGDCSSESS